MENPFKYAIYAISTPQDTTHIHQVEMRNVSYSPEYLASAFSATIATYSEKEPNRETSSISCFYLSNLLGFVLS